MIHFKLLFDWFPICWLENKEEWPDTTTNPNEVNCPDCLKILNGAIV